MLSKISIIVMVYGLELVAETLDYFYWKVDTFPQNSWRLRSIKEAFTVSFISETKKCLLLSKG